MRYEWESLQRKEGVVEKREADLRKDESVELTVATVATISGGLVAMGLYVFLTEPLWVLPALEWMTPGILYRLKTREALVALSFDDGPHVVFTPEVLEILERYGAKATFFLIGERAERHPELVERIRAGGHEIGNHCWRDGTVLGHSRARFEEELERTEAAIGRRGEEEKDLTQRPQREEHGVHREESAEEEGAEKRRLNTGITESSGPESTEKKGANERGGKIAHV